MTELPGRGLVQIRRLGDNHSMSLPDPELRARREAVVREHMESENRHEFDVTLATFAHPRYEIVPTGDVYDGENEDAVFVFEGDRIVCERVYFDAATILRQLGVAHDPLTLRGRVATLLNHPVTIGRAVARQVVARS